VIFGGVNYYSGQVFDMQTITQAAHEVGAYCGFDLAHAIGNVPLQMHAWRVDFACWCSYKYLNSGPGGVAGVYINRKHAGNTSLPRLAGWWGHDKNSRFQMGNEFVPIASAEGWQLSNAPVLSMAAHKASLDIFEEAGTERLYKKGSQLNDYLIFIIDSINNSFPEPVIEIITPRNINEKGCQLSLVMKKRGREVFEYLKQNGVIADWREPDVIRVAPVPLYNSFEDVYRFGEIIQMVLKNNN
jgi:kynureninase